MPKSALIVTPIAVSRFPWLNRPDTKWQAEGKYKCSLILDPSNEEHAKFIEQISELAKAAYERVKADLNPVQKKKLLPEVLSPLTEQLDEDGNPTGFVILNASQSAEIKSKKDGKVYKKTVALRDAAGKPFDPSILIRGGSKLRLAVSPQDCLIASGPKAGLSLRLIAAQVVHLADAADIFGAVKTAAEDGTDTAPADEIPAGDGGDGPF